MFELQARLNDKTRSTWRTDDLPWYRYIWTECGEMMDSSNFKHWKHQEIDHNNNIVELVDIWHFLMSMIIVADDVEEMKKHINDFVNDYIADYDCNNTWLRNQIDDMALYALKREPVMIFKSFYGIWNSYYRLHINDLFIHYMTKNVLNGFRQDNGYKDGSYKKVWNGLEDNVVAFKIAESLDISDQFVEELKSKLQAVYDTLS